MRTILIFFLLTLANTNAYSQKKSKSDFKDILDLDAIKSDQDYFSQAIIQFQLLEKIIQKYGAIYHLYPKENPSLLLRRGQFKNDEEKLKFDIENGSPTMVLFGNTIMDGNSRMNEINEELYQLGVDRCQYQIPLSLDDLDSGFQFNHYMFSSNNKAALNAFGIVKNNYDSESLYIVIDYIQYKDNQCPGIPKIRYGVGIRSEIKITNWNNSLDIKESSLAGLAANAEINSLKVNITVKTIGITGLDSKLNIPTNTSFDVNTFADYQKIIDFIRQFDEKETFTDDTSTSSTTQNTTPSNVEKRISELKEVVEESIKQKNSYQNIVFKPQMIPVMDEYRTSISQSFKSFYETLNDFEKRINKLMKEKKKYESLKQKDVKNELEKAKVMIYEEKISAITDEINDIKRRKNDLKEANNLVYDLERFKNLLKVISNYKTSETKTSDINNNTGSNANPNGGPLIDNTEKVNTNKINENISKIYRTEYYIIAGADKKIEDAKFELNKALKYNPYSMIVKKGDWFRVVMPNYKSTTDAKSVLEIIKRDLGNNNPQIVDKDKWCPNGLEQGENCLICK